MCEEKYKDKKVRKRSFWGGGAQKYISYRGNAYEWEAQNLIYLFTSARKWEYLLGKDFDVLYPNKVFQDPDRSSTFWHLMSSLRIWTILFEKKFEWKGSKFKIYKNYVASESLSSKRKGNWIINEKWRILMSRPIIEKKCEKSYYTKH